MIKGIIFVALITLSLQTMCSVNGAKGECTLIGECAGTQILSQCGSQGYGCCLTGAYSLAEDYREFGFWGWLKNAWNRFKEDPWKYIKIIAITIKEIFFMESSFEQKDFQKMTEFERKLFRQLKKLVNNITDPLELKKELAKIIDIVDKHKLAPEFIPGKFNVLEN